MSKILQSLPLTITAGVVLTILLAFVTEHLTTSASDMPDAADAAAEHLDHVTQ